MARTRAAPRAASWPQPGRRAQSRAVGGAERQGGAGRVPCGLALPPKAGVPWGALSWCPPVAREQGAL